MKTWTQTLLTGALLTAAATAFAGPHHPGHGHRGAVYEGAGMDPERRLAIAVRRLDLDANQETAIRDLFEDRRDDLEANREASRKVREDLLALIDAGVEDPEALAELAAREGELAEERVMLRGTLASGVLAELTDEQRAELQAMRTEREERRRERFGARRDSRRSD